MKRVVVTGGFGKLGKFLVARPSQPGWSVASEMSTTSMPPRGSYRRQARDWAH